MTNNMHLQQMTPGEVAMQKSKRKARFIDNGDGTVTDTQSGLMWTQDDLGRMPHANAAKACKGLDLGGHKDWRLSTIEELFALADRSRQFPTIDTAFFPGCRSNWYWSSTAGAWDRSCAWFVDFGYGAAYCFARNNDVCVRAVREVKP